MDINFKEIIVIVVIASLCWYGNETLNRVPGLKPIISFLIILISVLCLLQSTGLMTGMHSHVVVS